MDVFFDGVASETVETGRENRDNGEEVINELLFWGRFWLMENHDFPIGVEESFKQVKTESTQSIFVGNHNFSEMTLDCGVHIDQSERSRTLKMSVVSLGLCPSVYTQK